MAPRLDLLGVQVTAFDLPTAVTEMAEAIATGRRAYACPCPVYTLMQGNERDDVRAALNGADWVAPDGMPVVWALHGLGARHVGRVYGPDLMLALSELSAQRGFAQFYLGGAPGVAEALAERMRARFTGLVVAGTRAPRVREAQDGGASEDDDALDCETIEAINSSGAHVVWVGLGSPKQDLWMARHRPALTPPLLVGVGAAFDFLSGRKRQAPRWVQKSGLEWLFRLCSEPRRLWRRYAVYNPKFAVKVALQMAGRHSHRAR